MTLPYGGTVLEHFKRPRNQRTIRNPSAAREGYNPLCGDRVRMEVVVSGAYVVEAAFTANACAICTASASLLTERVGGMLVAEASRIPDAEAVAALETEVPAGRWNCASLPARALREALAELNQPA